MGQDTHTFPERKKKGKKAPDSVSEYILRRGGGREDGGEGGERVIAGVDLERSNIFHFSKWRRVLPLPPSTHDHPLFIEQQDSHPPLLQSYFDSQNAHFSPLDVFLLHPRRVEPLKRGGGGRKGPSSSSSSAFLSATSTSSLLIKQRTWARGDRGQKGKEEQTGNLH